MATRIVLLRVEDTDRIIGLERRSFIPVLQATADTIVRRFELGHLMYGMEDGKELVAMLAASYGHFDPNDFAAFPKTERDYALQKVPADYNGLLTYNMEVEPSSRGRDHSRLLFAASMDRAKADGCTYVVGCSRVPSYAGSDPEFSAHEQFRHSPQVKTAIDQYLQGGLYPSQETLLKDPLLALYYDLGKPARGKFHWIIPNFAPYDRASGGIRVIIYGEIRHWQPQGSHRQ